MRNRFLGFVLSTAIIFFITATIQPVFSQALKWENLLEAIPVKLDGWGTAETDGATLNMAGLSYSQATAEFTDPNGNRLQIMIADYSQAAPMFMAATATWGNSFSIDTKDSWARSFDPGNGIIGWETYDKISKTANVLAGVKERYFISIQVDGKGGTDFAKSILNKINLSRLP